MSDLLNTAASAAGSLLGSALGAHQSFRTSPVGQQGLAYYTLTLRKPGDLKSIIPYLSYTFPLSPQEIRKTPVSLNTMYDTAGSPANGGVTRDFDLWGESPPVFEIRGTTGWKHKNTDAYLSNGLTSIQKLEDILTQYAKLNQKQMAAGKTKFYTLEFYDYFKNDFWQVVPIGPQGVDINAQNPLMSYYSLRLACVQKVSSPIPPGVVDLIGNTIGTGALSAVSSLNSFTRGITGLYSNVSSGVSSLYQGASSAISKI